MNRKIINQINNIKLTHQIDGDQYEVVFGTLNISFNTFNEANKTFSSMVEQNQPTMMQRFINIIQGPVRTNRAA